MVEMKPKNRCVRITKTRKINNSLCPHNVREGERGIIITEGNIDEICKNENQKERFRDLLVRAQELGGNNYVEPILLEGYPCLVPIEWFEICDKPINIIDSM